MIVTNSKRLVDTFIELVKIDSVSGNEGQFVTFLKQQLEELGLSVAEDTSMETTYLGANNLIATHIGSLDKSPIFFSCHVDTVEPGTNIEVIEKDGTLYSKGNTILAADGKAGIAILLESIRSIKESGLETGSIEFVFSPGEEIGLVGSNELDMSMIEGTFGYVLGAPGPVGQVVSSSPFLYTFEIAIEGNTHSKKTVSASIIAKRALAKIPNGKINLHTTSSLDALPDEDTPETNYLVIEGEIRSTSNEEAQAFLHKINRTLQQICDQLGGEYSIDISKKASGFNLKHDALPITIAKRALKNIQRSYTPITSDQCNDANTFNATGKETLNLAVGYENIHTIDECIPIEEMERSVELVLSLINEVPMNPAENKIKEVTHII